jgi:hypothetical protein
VCGCALTESTSYGFDVAWFAEHVLGTPLDPWEVFAAIHGGELYPDGRPRFRKLLIIVARQQGKTLLCRVLTLYWQFIERWPLILGTSTNLGYAKESWQAAVALAEATPDLARDIPSNGVRKAAGEECLSAVDPEDHRRISRYKIAASNRKGGRSLTIDRLILDELREHADWSAWGASYNAMSARPSAQVVAITNQGDDSAVVLDSLRNGALSFIETGEGDERLGLLEWSTPEDADPEDPVALAMSNPNLGRRTMLDDLLADARRAKENGGEELATFKTEIMCIRVNIMNPAIDKTKWTECLSVGDLSEARSRLAACLDVSLDEQHATLAVAAMMPGGKVRIEGVKAWSGPTCVRDLERDLPGLVKKLRPQKLGWFGNGPAAAVAATMAKNKKWPAGVEVDELRGEATAVCMSFASMVKSLDILHSNDKLINAHVTGAEKLMQGDAWRFTRKGAGHCDAAYAPAGAVFLARTLPPPVGKPRLIVAS